MKTRTVETITNNDEFVRMRIFDGDLLIEEGAAEVLRLEIAQHKAEIERLKRVIQDLGGC